eukprot:54248-Eustigmatos_ZCMA.PRE.2
MAYELRICCKPYVSTPYQTVPVSTAQMNPVQSISSIHTENLGPRTGTRERPSAAIGSDATY